MDQPSDPKLEGLIDNIRQRFASERDQAEAIDLSHVSYRLGFQQGARAASMASGLWAEDFEVEEWLRKNLPEAF